MKITYLITKLLLARNALILTGTVFLALAAPQLSYATTISLVNNDSSGEGFNDPAAPFAGQTGNAGTTIGQQRLNVFTAAADYWEQRIVSSVNISVGIEFNPLSCNASGAILGSAGPNSVFRDFAGAPLASTWYVGAVANSIIGVDQDTNESDINARFNSDIDNNNDCLNGTNWWYGINSPAPGGTISLFDTVLHEIGHGLGVLSLVGQDGSKFLGFNDAYMAQLSDETSGLFWSNMTDGQRAAAAINTGNLVWRGVNADSNSGHLNAGLTNGHIRMFAPNPYQGGSSVSHWDTALSPDELMEPSATLTSDDTSTIQLLKDVGWQIVEGPGEIGFAANTYTVLEDKGPASISIERSSGNAGAVSVLISSADGTATGGGEDYNSINSIINWADGEMGIKTATIEITDDMVAESLAGETVMLTLSNSTGGPSITNSSSTLTIFDPVVDDGFLLNVVSVIAAAIKKTPPAPVAPILPKWSVVNEVCCGTSSARFSVTQGSDSRSSTAPSCSVAAPQSSQITSSAGNKSFRWGLSSTGCGDLGASFNFAFENANEYVFVAEFDNGVVVNVFSRPISGLVSGQKKAADSDLKLLQRIRLSVEANQDYKSNSGFQAIK
jgi:hypothetical protein